MKEQLISFETAVLAQEKLFKVPTYWFYSGDDLELYTYESEMDWYDTQFDENNQTRYNAPTQSLLQKWLREEFNINTYVTFECIDDSEFAYVWNVVKCIPEGIGPKKNSWDYYERESSFSERHQMWYKTYEEALEHGLTHVLKKKMQ